MGQFCLEVNCDTTVDGKETGDTSTATSLFDRQGNRKYLTRAERNGFLLAASHMSPEVRTFCLMLAYTGARVSEVLALTPQRIDVTDCVVIIESLKKRRRGIYRAIPIPTTFIRELDRVHNIAAARRQADWSTRRIWPWCRTTGWNWVKTCMEEAGISGSHATPKGLRHAFGVGALQASVPINLVRKWLGHSRLSTTEIYANAIGDEEKLIAKRFWKTF